MIRDARASDAEALARLHATSLPGSLLTELGHRALARYYRFAISSSHEHVWVIGGDEVSGADEVIAGCVLSEAPNTIMKRFLRYGPLDFAGNMARAVASSRSLRRRLLQGLRAGGSDGGHSPEVTQIFTDASRRGEGLGAQLLRVCEEALRARGTRKYFVHTQRDDNEAGIRFYRREGFVVIGESKSFGETFLVMQKDLD